jgi:hypothetical protein
MNTSVVPRTWSLAWSLPLKHSEQYVTCCACSVNLGLRFGPGHREVQSDIVISLWGTEPVKAVPFTWASTTITCLLLRCPSKRYCYIDVKAEQTLTRITRRKWKWDGAEKMSRQDVPVQKKINKGINVENRNKKWKRDNQKMMVKEKDGSEITGGRRTVTNYVWQMHPNWIWGQITAAYVCTGISGHLLGVFLTHCRDSVNMKFTN